MTKFLSERIEVIIGDGVGVPKGFIWRGRTYRIREIWGEWPDYGFGSLKRGRWWQRRHRTYFRVVTEEGEVFEIYLNRGGKNKRWFLYRKLDGSGRSIPQKPGERE